MERRRHLSRRAFVVGAGATGIGLLAGCGRLPFQGQSQPPAPVPRGGIFGGATTTAVLEPFREGLREWGYVDGQNVLVEVRSAEGQQERMSAIATELVQLPADVIVAAGDAAIRAARQASDTVPIVMAGSRDPIALGWVASLGRPGGNITGLSYFDVQLGGKRLELLHASLPGLARVVVLGGSFDAVGGPQERPDYKAASAAAAALGVQLQLLNVNGPDDLEPALETATRERAEALLVLATIWSVGNLPLIADLAAAGRLPTMSERREFAAAGGLMAYGANNPDRWRRAAYYVARILNGAKPSDLPVEQPREFEFVVNLKTARELGISLPEEIRLQVTEVIS